MDIVALQETKWPDNGKHVTKNFVFYYSGTHDGTLYGGVGFAVNKNIQDNIINFEAIDERLCTLRVKGKFKNISIICIYAPTLLANDDDKDTFYEKLEEKWNNLPSYDIKLIMGDANAQVGKEDVWREVAGRESLHDNTNNNGYRLLSMAAAGNIKIVSTNFPRKNIHKGTWVSPGGNYTNQIDHVLIDSRHKRSVTNVRSIRGAECGTDHYLVLVQFQQRIQCNKRQTSNRSKLLALEQLKEVDKYQDFQLKLENRLENIHQSDNANLDQKWNSMKTAIQETLKEVCETRKSNNKKPWFDSECKTLIQERKDIKIQWLANPTPDLKQRYSAKSKEVTKTLRRKKREWINGTIRKAEEDRTVNNSRDFYRTIRFFKKGYAPKTYGVKNTRGEVVMQTEEVLETWKTYFKDLLNCNNEVSHEESQIFQNVQPEVQKPSLEEVEKAIKMLKNNKAPGEDGITAEVLKAGGNVTAKEIHKLILEVWENEDLPQEWTEALIIPILKKGDKLNCNNYRGIALLNNTYKILSKIVQKRLEVFTEEIIDEHQAGFVKGRSTMDQILIIKESMAKYWEYNKECHLLFVDFSKAYDSLIRSKIWEKMENFGIPRKLVKLAALSVLNSKCKVKIDDKLTTPFEVDTGVRQGDGISPLLFNIALEQALQRLENCREGIHLGKKITVLAYADDIVLLAEKQEDLEEMAKILIEEAQYVGLKISDEKTKWMTFGRQLNRRNRQKHLKVNDHQFERVKEFKYLGVVLSSEGGEETEIQNRIKLANKCLGACNKVMSTKLLSHCSKIRIYKTIIRPVLIYGAENWILTKQSQRMLITFENKVLRKIFGPICIDGNWRRRHNHEIRSMFKNPDIVGEIRSSRLRWIGHIMRKEEDTTSRQVLQNIPSGRRPRGRPRTRFWNQVMEDIQCMNISLDEIEDRHRWRQHVDEAKYHLRYQWPQE
ncbi:hypothetical protein WDU94_005544 [Cyamophila willieti]